MQQRDWRYGCLFCRTGTEGAVVNCIRRMLDGVEAVAPMRTRRKTVAGRVVEDEVQLLPGYVFFRTRSEETPFRLTRITNVLKLLVYDNLSWELVDGDREFAEFLFDNSLFQPPHVAFIDGRLHFKDSFLYGHDDAVTRVNRRKKTAEVRLEIHGLTFWIGYIEA